MSTFNLISNTEPVSLNWLRAQDPSTRREVLGELAERGRNEDVDVLVASLKDDHPGVLDAAVSGLAKIGGDVVVQRLVKLLREPPAVRNMAVEVINQVVPAGWGALIGSLQSPDPDVRKFIIDAFGKHDDPMLIQPILPLLEDPSPNVRAAAAETLGHLRAREAVPGLIKLLTDEQWVVFSAVTALADIGDAAALEPLLQLIKQQDPAVTAVALDAIAAMDQWGRTLPLLTELADYVSPELQPSLVKTLVALTERQSSDIWSKLDRSRWLNRLTVTLQSDDLDARLAAMSALGLMGDQSAAGPILDMYACLEEASDDLADRAVQALVGVGNAQELMVAVEREDERVANIAIRALGVMRAPEAVSALGQVRRTSTDWDRRRLAVIALGLIGTDEALNHLIEAVDDETGYVRREAVHLLGDYKCEPAERALITRLKAERYQEVRTEIADTLVRIGTHSVMSELMTLLQSTRSEVREAAACAIGKAKLPEGLDALIDAMNDPDARVRRAVVEAISRYFDVRALPSLLIALSDDDDKVRLSAVIGVGRWKTPEAHQALLGQGLRDADVWVRYRSAEQLGVHRVAAAVPALSSMLSSPREPKLMKRAAIMALAGIGGPQAQAALTLCLQQDDPDIRQAAQIALQRDDAGAPASE
jgi:HEAT repeat protein